MEVLTPKATRRSTRLRVEIPVGVISLDRKRPFGDKCMLLVVSAQGCGFRSSEALQIETPIMLSGLPGGGSVTARVANCVPLDNEGNSYLIGAALYTHGNIWGIANPPEDWKVEEQSNAASPAREVSSKGVAAAPKAANKAGNKNVWPYNLFTEGAESHPGRR